MALAFPPIEPADWRSLALLQGLLDTIPDPIFAKDRAHRWIAVNDGFCRLIGHPRATLIGASDPEFWLPEQTAVFWQMDDLVFESGQANENEESATGLDGVERTLWTRKFPLRDPNGLVTGLCGIITDITGLKRRMREAERIERENAEHRGLIAAQAAMLAELRMPVVELGDRLLLVPLVGELCQSRFAHGTDELLTSIAMSFREHNVEMAFNQMDVYVKNLHGQEAQLGSTQQAPGSSTTAREPLDAEPGDNV